MKDKVWVIMHEEQPLCICYSETDAQELFMDLVMEVRYNNFCYDWLDENWALPTLEKCLTFEATCSYGGYWIQSEVPIF